MMALASNLVDICPGNGLLPDGTKPLPESMFGSSSMTSCYIHIRTISQKNAQDMHLWYKFDKSGVKRLNTLGHLDQYMA